MTGAGFCIVTPSSEPGSGLAFSPLDSATVSTTLSVVGPVTNCLLTAQVDGGTAAVITTNVLVTEAAAAETPEPIVAPAAGFTGTAPASGQIGLLGVTGAPTADELVTDLTAAGCTPESLAILVAGVWNIYIPGAPAVVNAGFPATVTEPAFFVRCR